MEERAEAAGIGFTEGRTRRSNSHLALQAAEFAAEHGQTQAFHRPLFEAYFERLEDIGEIDTLVRIGAEVGLPEADLRHALEHETYRQQIDDGVAWASEAGIRSVPTFIFDEEYAIVGAQEYTAFQNVMEQLGREPHAAAEA